MFTTVNRWYDVAKYVCLHDIIIHCSWKETIQGLDAQYLLHRERNWQNHIRWKCRPRKNTAVNLVQKVLTNTSHVTSCIVMLKQVLKISLLKRRQKSDRIKNIVSVFYDIQCSLNNFELSATIMKDSSPYHNTSASITVGLVHTLVCRMFPRPAVHTMTFIA